jgi:hypothetical protein
VRARNPNPATMDPMDRTARWKPARWAVTALALLTVFALVLGVRPRVIAEQSGFSPAQTGVCFLCDGAATAATVAPAADSVSLGLAAPMLVFPCAIVVDRSDPLAPAGLGNAPPPQPPPRA